MKLQMKQERVVRLLLVDFFVIVFYSHEIIKSNRT